MTLFVPMALAIVSIAMQSSHVTGCCDMDMLCSKVDDVVNATDFTQQAVKSLDERLDELEKKVDLSLMYSRLHTILLLLDKTKFDVSPLYKDRIYLASKETAAFNLYAANEECKYQGGYLLEIDDNDERMFTWNFASRIGGAPHFATGGNDVAIEDVWVYYHSGKPVPKDLVWVPGRPNNVGGNEDCMAFWMSQGGLNDVPCYEDVKYICEIPLNPNEPTTPVLTRTEPSS